MSEKMLHSNRNKDNVLTGSRGIDTGLGDCKGDCARCQNSAQCALALEEEIVPQPVKVFKPSNFSFTSGSYYLTIETVARGAYLLQEELATT